MAAVEWVEDVPAPRCSCAQLTLACRSHWLDNKHNDSSISFGFSAGTMPQDAVFRLSAALCHRLRAWHMGFKSLARAGWCNHLLHWQHNRLFYVRHPLCGATAAPLEVHGCEITVIGEHLHATHNRCARTRASRRFCSFESDLTLWRKASGDKQNFVGSSLYERADHHGFGPIDLV